MCTDTNERFRRFETQHSTFADYARFNIISCGHNDTDLVIKVCFQCERELREHGDQPVYDFVSRFTALTPCNFHWLEVFIPNSRKLYKENNLP